MSPPQEREDRDDGNSDTEAPKFVAASQYDGKPVSICLVIRSEDPSSDALLALDPPVLQQSQEGASDTGKGFAFTVR
jgi:hypothetical protein